MGIAFNRAGDLFATDNQGNYTPFNELNHIQSGQRYGFINKLERQDGFSPRFQPPAINIPHPWTRSVNGICFLDTPQELLSQQGPLFGPFEGQLIGCEMNGRTLIRLSLQLVAGQYQGAAYPFCQSVQGSQPGFEGPIVCAVSPEGSIYVGNLHDSGWGGGNNTGSVVRLKPSGDWPLGIAQVQAIPTGLEIQFTAAVDPNLAADRNNYSLRSYVRVATPAYGGDDQEQQMERISGIEISADSRIVRLQIDRLRSGAVYELNISAIGPGATEIFPSQAHYTMRAVPQ
jgi:hypothetical protein